MSDSYTKLFRSIVSSTVAGRPYSTRWLWVVLLSQADKHGRVYASVPGLARLANITLQECQEGLSDFLAPDEFSRSRDENGRRIREIDGGWELVTHAKHKAARSEEERKEYKREWDRKNRYKKSDTSDSSDKNPTNSDSPTPPALTPTPDTKEKHQKNCAAPTKEPSAPAPKPVMCIPTNTGAEFPIHQDLVSEYASLYPAVDVIEQLRKMRAWSISNPTRRKTKTGMLRAVNTWLSKAQDEASDRIKGKRGMSLADQSMQLSQERHQAKGRIIDA